MKRILTFLIFTLLSCALKSQTVIDVTIDTIYFFISKNDTVILEPTMVTPGMSVVTNYNQTGAQLYLSDTFQNCCDEIQNSNLKCSIYSVLVKRDDEQLIVYYNE